MNGTVLTLIVTWILVAVLLIVQPWLTRRNVLFGVVFGDDSIWEDNRAKNIRMRYILVMAAGTIVISLIIFAWSLAEKLNTAAMIIPYLSGIGILLVYGTIIFISYHAKALELKAENGPDTGLVSNKVSVETSLPDSMTVIPAAWLWLLLPVLLVTYGIAVFGYPFIPEKVPIHYSYLAADAWAQKSWSTVLFPLLIETAVAVLLFVCCLFTRRAPASVRGNPGAAPKAFQFRKYIIILLIVLGIVMETTFLLIEINFLTPLSPLLLMLPVVLDFVITAAIFIVYFRFVRVKKPKGPILDDDAKWVLGMFYFNPSDPSTFVEKRTGIGYTINFARPGGWILLIGVLVFVVLSIVASYHV